MLSGTSLASNDHAAKVERQLAILRGTPVWLPTAILPLALKRSFKKARDPISEEQRAFLVEKWFICRPEVQDVENAGHLAQTLSADEYLKIIRQFLNAY